jgi:hypothetical protein
MLMRCSPLVGELSLYDVAPVVKGVACDLSHCDVGGAKVGPDSSQSIRSAALCTLIYLVDTTSAWPPFVRYVYATVLQVTGYCGDAELGACLTGCDVSEIGGKGWLVLRIHTCLCMLKYTVGVIALGGWELTLSCLTCPAAGRHPRRRAP